MEKRIRSYRDLEVWQKGMALVEAVYRQTQHFPANEKFGLSSQMQRAAVSVPANIAEGHGRKYRREYANFVSNAHGSLMELETHLMIAQRVGYLNGEVVQGLLEKTESLGRMLNALVRSLQSPPSPTPDTRHPTPKRD